jgi:hypothetical protein
MLIFLGRKMSMGKNEYVTPEQPTAKTSTKVTNAGKKNTSRKSKYVLTHTHFSPHTSFSPLLFNRVFLIFMYMVEDIIVKCGRKRVSTMIIVITKASSSLFYTSSISPSSPSSFYYSPSILSIVLFIFLPSCPLKMSIY